MRRFVFNLSLLTVVFLLAGFVVFIARLPAPKPAQDMPQAGAIVVLTGGGGTRIRAAIQLLEEGRAHKLFISGVNGTVSANEIQKLFALDPALMKCCVSLGYQARNTLGNAGEIAVWANENQYRKIIVVTSAYHMPRALIELRGTQSGAKFYPFPVRTDNFGGVDKWRQISIEYLKYIVILGRELILDHQIDPKQKAA